MSVKSILWSIFLINFGCTANFLNSSKYSNLLDEFYIKEHALIPCNILKGDITAKAILDCIVEKINGSLSYCEVNERLLKIEGNYQFDQQPYLKDEEQKELENSSSIDILVKINLIDGKLNLIETKYYICVLLPNSTVKLYPLIHKDICYDQKQTLNLLYKIYNTSLKSIMKPTMITSIIFAAFIIIIYLSLPKLRNLYLGKCVICHCFSFIAYQLLFINNFRLFTANSINLTEVILVVLQDVFRMSSYCWMNVMSFQACSALIRSVLSQLIITHRL